MTLLTILLVALIASISFITGAVWAFKHGHLVGAVDGYSLAVKAGLR